jgi:ribosomal protein L35
MPKLKTRKAALKRYKITGTYNFLRRHAFKGHLFCRVQAVIEVLIQFYFE